jgi:hypothetical protein
MKASKEMKKNGKIVVKGPKVKERKKPLPANKVEKSKKAYDRKRETFDEDEQMTVPLKREPSRYEKIGSDLRRKNNSKPPIDYSKLGEVPKKQDPPKKNRIQQMDDDMKKRKFNEDSRIHRFIEAVMSKDYNNADRLLKDVVKFKITQKIREEFNTPLF